MSILQREKFIFLNDKNKTLKYFTIYIFIQIIVNTYLFIS